MQPLVTHHYSDLSLLRAAGGTAHQFTLLFVYFMCTPRCIIFFQCGPGQSKVWTPLLWEKNFCLALDGVCKCWTLGQVFLQSVSPLVRLTPLYVLVTIFTKKESKGKSQILGLSPGQEVTGNLPMGTPVSGTAV